MRSDWKVANIQLPLFEIRQTFDIPQLPLLTAISCKATNSTQT